MHRFTSIIRIPSFGLIALALAACSASKDPGGPEDFDSNDPASDSGSGGDTHTLPTDADDDGGLHIGDTLAPTDTGGSCPAGDCDKDGYLDGKDDCDDHDGTINPEAYDFEGDGVDNDCDGTKDNPITNCPPADSSATPQDFVRAGDLCAQRSKTKAGPVMDPLVKAEWYSSKGGFLSSTIVAGNNHTTATKIINSFGSNAARMGTNMIGISSGVFGDKDPGSRTATGGLDGSALGGVSSPCTAIPIDSDACKSLTNGSVGGLGLNINDYTELRITIKVPSNAQALLFDYAFFSSEFNQYWNTPFNDAFFAVASTAKFKNTNVAKDSKGLAITVNSGFFQLCPKSPGPSGLQKPTALANCVGVGGDTAASIFGTLAGTNFDGAGMGSTDDTIMAVDTTGGPKLKFIYGGGSGWLNTKFGVDPGETITLRFMVMDTSDGILDSAALVDHLTWEKSPPKTATGETGRPPR